MNTKRLTLIIVFIALTVALNVAGPKIPAPYAPFLIYQIWEIPIVVAFLAMGPKVGVAITVVNSLILFAVFQGSLPSGPFYNLIAVLAMLLGIYIPYKIVSRGNSKESLGSVLQKHLKSISVATTALAIVLRIAVTTPTNYVALQLPYPFGFGLNSSGSVALLPPIALFNATVTLYTVPIALAVTIPLLSRFKF